MKYIVCLKQTPDTAELPKITPEQALAGNEGASLVLNPWDEYAVEEAIRLKERFGGESVAITGKMSVDGNSGAVAHGLACKLGVSLLTQVAKIVEVGDGKITVERLLDEGRETVTAPLPAVVSVVKEINEPRYPTFIRIRKASRVQIPVLSASDLGLSPDEVGAGAARVRWTNLVKPEPKKREVVIIEGETPEEKARKLLDYLIEVEKVL